MPENLFVIYMSNLSLENLYCIKQMRLCMDKKNV